MQRRFNHEYAGLWQEIPLLFLFPLLASRDARCPGGSILIATPSLIGEFAASIPAIADFVRRHPSKQVSLYVSPSVAELARKLRGVSHVYTAHTAIEGPFEQVIVLRMRSRDFSRLRRVRAGRIDAKAGKLARYSLHLWRSLVTRKTPVQWKAFNFELLGGTPRAMALDDIFEFSDEERRAVAAHMEKAPGRQTVIVHTGTTWIMKQWPLERWVELMNKMQRSRPFDIVFVGAGREAEDYEYIRSRAAPGLRSLVSRLSLIELVIAMSRADVFIGVDSGPGNIAHLAGLPSVIIYGPGPHMYLSDHPRAERLDRSGGRGFAQMFFAKRPGFIHRIEADEAFRAFERIITHDIEG
jgi:ADP-heptose:LPS heptosyltransferase